MIKNLEKDLRTYRKDTFITSFFATITILLIVLILCSVPSHAQSVSGGSGDNSWSFDDENLKNLKDYYNFDTDQTDPVGLLNFDDNPNKEIIRENGSEYDNKYDLGQYYLFRSKTYNPNAYDDALSFLNSCNVPTSWTYGGSAYSLSDFSNFYLISKNLVNSGLQPYIIVSDSTVFVGQNNLFTLSGNSFKFNFIGNSVSSISTTNSATINDPYYQGDVNNFSDIGNAKIIYSNSDIEAPQFEYTNSTRKFIGFTNYNYLQGQTGNGGSPSDIEMPENNLVMNDGDWTFKNDHYSAPYDSSFPTGSIYPNGNISFSFNPTEYQIANPSAFELVFTFYMNYDVNYKNWNQKFSVFEQTSQLLNNSKRYSHTYNYNDGGAVEIVVPLSDFINNGNNRSWTWQDVFDKLEDGAFTSVLNNSRELYSVSYNKFDLTASAYIKSASDKSGNITEWYNPMSKKGYTTDDSGSLNKNPYVPSASDNPDSSNTQNPEGNAPGEGGNNGNGGSTNISNGGNVTVYNYNTNNNNNTLNSDGNTFNDIFNTMIGSNKVTSESLADTTGTNGFLSFMNNTLGGVPISFFTSLLNFFTTCLAILIVAFVLRMLLDIL